MTPRPCAGCPAVVLAPPSEPRPYCAACVAELLRAMLGKGRAS